jgi:hypothetical protein
MNAEIEITDMAGRSLVRMKSTGGVTPLPNVGDRVSIESKTWEVAARVFLFREDGTLRKVNIRCAEID